MKRNTKLVLVSINYDNSFERNKIIINKIILPNTLGNIILILSLIKLSLVLCIWIFKYVGYVSTVQI